jgi:4-amino-4-deoxy-L-arabinose transferase-like glycosyltransferase
MCTVALGMVASIRRWALRRPWLPLALRRPWLPLALLAVLACLSLGARAEWLGAPCRVPCLRGNDHLVIFDEDYYVNAARVIAGIRPPAEAPYAHSPLGTDPNAEHPQLAKLVMAGSIELLGDGPLAWRLGSLVFGTVAILGMYALARAAGGGRWLALGAAALMASDNLVLVHGRIGTLDIYALAAMVWGAALYLRGRALAAGVIIGVGACAKEVAPYALLVLAVFEAGSSLPGLGGRRARVLRLGTCFVAMAVTVIALLSLLDAVAPPYADAAGQRVTGGAFAHIAHILDYAAHQTSPHGPRGIASYPWAWLVDLKPIIYLNINPSRPSAGLTGVAPAVHFLGMISPPVLVAGMLGLMVAGAFGLCGVRRRWRRSRWSRSSGRPRWSRSSRWSQGSRWSRWARYENEEPGCVGALAVAWFLATWIPFALASLLLQRTSYLYYMVIVMPAIYLGAVYLIARVRLPWPVTWLWAGTALAAAVVMYPLTPIPL